jgi:hypothetical protein
MSVKTGNSLVDAVFDDVYLAPFGKHRLGSTVWEVDFDAFTFGVIGL